MRINVNNKTLLTVGILITIFVSLLVVNFISDKLFGFIRFDLTKNRVFTLSAGSKNVLSKIDEPIALKLFFSKQLAKENPYFLSFATRVEEFLKQYQRYSRNKITLKVIDPLPYTEYEDQAVHYGLQGVPISNEAELYFGLVATNATTGKEVIPFLQPNRENYLEYDVTQLISKLNNNSLPKLAVITSLPIQGEVGFQYLPTKARPWVIWQQIKQQFAADVLEDESIANIPNDTKVLLLINTGEPLPLITAKAIDQFVMQGGRVLLLLDPVSETKPQVPPSSQEKAAKNDVVPINKLLESWGIQYDANKVVASMELAKQAKYIYEGKEIIERYPLWIDANGSSFAKDDVLTSSLTKLTFASSGFIMANAQSTSKFSPLVTIHKGAMVLDKEEFFKYKANPVNLLREYKPQAQPITLAARVTGKIKSAFKEEQYIEQANIIVVANADFLHEHFWATVQNFMNHQVVTPNSGNSSFILNALDNLTGSNDLISIRNKDLYVRGFDKIHEIELKSQSKFQQTEGALLQRIEETKQKLANMDQQKLSVEHKRAEESFRKDLIQTRKELREVRRSLREDIQVLENKIKFFSIVFIPLLIILSFISYWVFGDKFLNLFRYKKI